MSTTPPMRFLCDRMLIRLGKWLRAAGHDAVIAGARDHDDRALVLRARAEDRVLLTCDRRLVAAHGAHDRRVLLLADGRPEQAAPELVRRLGVDWCLAPFSRCLEDNTPLRAATGAEWARVPREARRPGEAIMACPACGRVYWPGSHVRRMRRRLERWRDG